MKLGQHAVVALQRALQPACRGCALPPREAALEATAAIAYAEKEAASIAKAASDKAVAEAALEAAAAIAQAEQAAEAAAIEKAASDTAVYMAALEAVAVSDRQQWRAVTMEAAEVSPCENLAASAAAEELQEESEDSDVCPSDGFSNEIA